MSRGKSTLARKNDWIRTIAGSFGRWHFQCDEEIVAAVENEYGQTLTEREQQYAIKAYTEKRNKVLGGRA